MSTFIKNKDNIPLIVAGCTIAAVVLSLAAPEEATLGGAVKLVFIHAALMWVGFFMFTLSAILSLAYLINGREYQWLWAQSSLITALAILFTTGLLGMFTAKVTWGAVVWREPRLAMLIKILAAGLITLIATRIIAQNKVNALIYLALNIIAWWLLLTTEKIIHPNNPIFTSSSTAIKVFPLLITLFLAVAALQVARGLRFALGAE